MKLNPHTLLAALAASATAHRLVHGLALLALLAALPAAGFAAQPFADTKKRAVIVGGDHNYPPYEFLDKDGNPAGFAVELTLAIAETMGFPVEIRLGVWDDMRQALDTGAVDLLEGTVQSEARGAHFEFSTPHSMIRQSVFGRKGANLVSDISLLRGKELIVQKGGSMHDYLIEQKVEAKYILVETHADAMRLLSSGKHDYALIANLPGMYFSRELGLSNVIPVGKLFAQQAYGYAAKKGNVGVLAKFNEGIAILRNTGRYQQLHDKWLGAYEPQGPSFAEIARYGAIVIVPILGILIGSVVWNRTLQSRISSRTLELRRQQEQLIQADKMASLGILVSGVAHEINNPTGLILYNIPVLKKSYQAAAESLEARFREEGDFMIGGIRYSMLREEIPRMFDEMQEGGNRIKRIVEDLKDFARKDNSELNEQVDLNAVLRASIRLVENTIKKATHSFTVNYAEGLPPFLGNSQRIEQVLVNLILNACQALPSPDREIRIVTSHDKAANEIELCVHDQGVGIAKENISHVTDPFFTTKRDSGGTGLGLSVSAGIVKDHNGRLRFKSRLGQGATVIVSFPAAARECAP